MKKVLQFVITKGQKQYVAQGVELPLVTQAKTLDELAVNIREAVSLHLEGENPSELGLAPDPAVLLNYELPTAVHA